MKKKTIALVMAMVMLFGIAVGGTIAYLTSRDEVHNTFTVGDVQIKLDEKDVDENGKPIADAERVKENDYHLLPGHEYEKDPMVTVLAKSEESYVRMLVTINEKADLDAIGFDMTKVFVGYDGTKWGFVQETDNEDNTMTYEFRYYTTVNTMDGNDKALEPLFTSIKMPADIDNTQLATLKDLKIDVVGQAIQADGFANADVAWAAFK